MSIITPFPEPESPELERFAQYGREDILALLRDLRDRQVLVTVYYDRAAGFSLGNVIEVDDGAEQLLLDCAADPSAQRAIENASEIVVIAFPDNTTKIQFTVAGADAAAHQDRLAFRVRLPRRVLRLQRRSATRRQPLVARPATCLVPVPGENGRYECVRVLDISIGGLAILAPPVLFELARDQKLFDCYLDLPEVGQVTVALNVRYMDAWPGEGGGRRCGCEYVELGGPTLRAIQRYMNRLEAQSSQEDRHAA